MEVILYKYSRLEIEDTVTKFGEKNCCTVVAISIVMNIPFIKSQRHLSEYCGRVKGKGVTLDNLKRLPESFKDYKTTVFDFSGQYVTLRKFCEENPQGRFFVLVRGHALAVIDGVVYDHLDKPRRIVKWVMKVEEKH